MSKPFITYTAQVEKLKNEKNLVITDNDFAVESLQNISYYALIGGYKHPFIDIHTRKYINEACFEDIVVLYEFDEELRGIFFKYLCRVERKMRSSISYHFCKKHGERQEEYLNSNNYGNIPKNKNGITKLIKMLDMMANKNKDHEYLVYQRNKYHNIPLWVIMNTLTFGQISKKTFVDEGMCADWSIHDKGDGNPHVHLLVTMRPFNPDHSWGSKEVKDWDFVRDTDGNIVVDESHPDWWQDKKNPDRHGIRIPVLDENGVQKVGARNRKQWKRVLTDATGWNNPKNCELWRSEWAGMCNRHLSIDNQIDHRSYERQGKLKIPTIHEGADARKIEEKYLTGQIWNGSWKVEENQMIKKQNALLQKVITTFGKVSGALSIWKEWLNDIRRKQRSNSHDGSNDYTDRGTAEYHGRNASGNTGKGREADVLSGEGRTIAAIRERIIRTASNLAGYRRTADASGRKGRPDTATYRRESAMAGISTEIKQREPAIAETEQRIADIEQQIEKARDIDDRIRKLKERRSTGRIATADGADAGRTRPERPDYRGTENADRRIADLEREVKQREQSREHSSLKERLEENKRIIAERERENARCRNHDRGMSR